MSVVDGGAPPPTLEISITAGAGVTEGGDATFTIAANPAPTADLTVSVNVGRQGDYGVTTGPQTVTVGMSGTATLTVSTTDDGMDEADGSVTATLNTGSGYSASGTAVRPRCRWPPPRRPTRRTHGGVERAGATRRRRNGATSAWSGGSEC